MPSIEIDFEVYKVLTNKRESEAVSYNDVVRDLLKMKEVKDEQTFSSSSVPFSVLDWIYKGIRFPNGSEFRASYKGVVYFAKVENGSLIVSGKSVSTPSEAAKTVTNTNVNGWTFWECRFPGSKDWKLLKSLRPVRS